MTSLRLEEEQYVEVCEKAKSRWVSEVCCKLNESKDPKTMWRQFRKLTSYQDDDVGGVLPLMNETEEPVFDQLQKCMILEKAFFSGSHMKNEVFDDVHFKEIQSEFED